MRCSFPRKYGSRWKLCVLLKRYEPETTLVIERELRRGITFVDIGAAHRLLHAPCGTARQRKPALSRPQGVKPCGSKDVPARKRRALRRFLTPRLGDAETRLPHFTRSTSPVSDRVIAFETDRENFRCLRKTPADYYRFGVSGSSV